MFHPKALQEAELDIRKGVYRGKPLFENLQLGMVDQAHPRVWTYKYMAGSFRVMVATRALASIPFSPEVHHAPSSRVTQNKLRVP